MDRYRPDVWFVPGSASKRIIATQDFAAGVPVPESWVLSLPGTAGWAEVALLVPHGDGTLVTCQVPQDHHDGAYASLLALPMTRMLGFRGGLIVAPTWRKHPKVASEAVRRALASILEASFEDLVTGHGPAIVGGAHGEVLRDVEAASR